MKLSSKVAIAFIGIFIVLLILFIILSRGGTTPSSNKATNTTPTPNAPIGFGSLSPTSSTTAVPTPIPKSATVEKLVYSYPSTWKTATLPVANGGTNAHYYETASDNTYFPEFTVQEAPNSTYPSIEKLVTYLATSYQLPITQITYKGVASFNIQGIESLTAKTTNPVYKRFLIVPYQSDVYIIDYAYYSKGPDVAANKQYLENLVNSFSFLP